MQVWLNNSRYPSVDMATYFAKEQYAGVYNSFYDFASRYYGIDNYHYIHQIRELDKVI